MRNRLERAGRAQPVELQLVVHGEQRAQPRPHPALADQEVVVARIARGLPAGHHHAERETGADEVEEQIELGRGERRDPVVALDDVAQGARTVGGDGVGGGDGEAADPWREAQVAEVEQTGHAVSGDEDVAVVGVVVDGLGGQRAERRGDAVGDVVEHGPGDRAPLEVGDGGEQLPLIGGGDEVPQQRARQVRMPEPGQGAVDTGDGGAEGPTPCRRRRPGVGPDPAGQPGQHASQAVADPHRGPAAGRAQRLRDQRRGGGAREVVQRGDLEVDVVGLVLRVQLDHVHRAVPADHACVEGPLAGQRIHGRAPRGRRQRRRPRRRSRAQSARRLR